MHVNDTAQEYDKALVRQARALVADLNTRRPWLYWVDLLLTSAIAWFLTAVFFTAPALSAMQVLALFGAGVAFFRAGTFIHEIVHMGRREMRGFKAAWNALVGIPLLMPWVLYTNHIEHHTRSVFGTPRDGEYLPLAVAPLSETFKYLAQIPLLPLLAVLRFGVLGPLSLLHNRMREWFLWRTSAMVTNPYYRKRFPARLEHRLLIAEVLCFAWLLFLVLLTLFGPMQAAHWLMAWLLLMTAVGLNWIRNLASHGYSNRGERMSHAEQLEDSVNLVGQSWVALWLFPVGLRYHGLHHLLPGLPYHNLGAAHRRLARALPPDSPYHSACHRSFFRVLAKMLAGARDSSAADSPIPRWRADSG